MKVIKTVDQSVSQRIFLPHSKPHKGFTANQNNSRFNNSAEEE